MNKREFLSALSERLSGLPKEDIAEHLDFYGEMLDDRMEDGLSEEEAVCDIGSVDEIAEQIIADTYFVRIARERIKPNRRLKAWERVLLAVGSPIWVSLAIALSAVILSLYIVLWAIIISLWAIFASFAACAVGGVSACVIFLYGGNSASGLAMLAAGMVCAGLAIFSFFGCKAATKGIVALTEKVAIGIKNRVMKRREV